MLQELLDPGRISIATSTDRDEVFRSCIERFEDPAAREQVRRGLASYPDLPFGSLEDQILIPHFRVPGLTRPEAVLAILPRGLPGKTGLIRLILILASPEAETGLHLRLLQGLSSLLPQAEIELLRSSDAHQAWTVIAEAERTLKPSYKNLTQKQVEFELQADLSSGLTAVEAAKRLAHFGPNRIRRSRGTPRYVKLLRNFFGFFAVLLWIAAGLCFLPGVDMPQLGFAIAIVIAVNGVFSYLQEARADKAVEALRRLMAPSCRVLREGKEKVLAAEALMPGDLVLLQEGEVVPADCRLIEASGVEIDSSLLTGESTSSKRYKSDREILLPGKFLWIELPNILFAGSSLIKGSAKAVVFGTGMATEIGHIAALTARIRTEPSPLQKQIQATVYAIAGLALGIGITFFLLGWLGAGLSFVQAFVFFIGIFVANVPEGLLPTVTLALAMGVSRMARRNVIVKDLASVETLGCTTVICSDKTGTLTQNLMMVTGLSAGGEPIEVSGSGYDPNGRFLRAGKEMDREALFAEEALRRLLECAFLCNNARLDRSPGGTRIAGDPTEGALLVLAERAGVSGTWQRLHLNPFESVRKRMSVVVRDGDGRRLIFVKGGPAEILSTCTRVLRGAAIEPIDERARRVLAAEADRYARDGYRVLGFAFREDGSRAGVTEWNAETTECDLVYLGLAALADPIRPGVADAVRTCHAAGIRILMVTGDHPLTADSIARLIGLGEAEPKVSTGSDIDALSDLDLREVVRNGEPVFARVSPEQKLRIVAALKDLGEVVAVTGDGVKDGPALKRADIGIAMGQRGTEVAKEAARIVLADDNFASIVAAVEEGRAVFENIRRFSAYIFNSNPQEVLPFLLWALVPGFPLLMTVMGVLAVDVGTDLVPAMGLGVEPPEQGIMEKPPRRKEERLLSMRFILRAYLVQGAILCLACFATWYYFVETVAGGRIPASPPGLDMARATPLYLQALTAFFFPTVAVQIANVLCKRSWHTSLFARDFLPEELRAALLERLRSWRPRRYAFRVRLDYHVERLGQGQAARAFRDLLWNLLLHPLRLAAIVLSRIWVRLGGFLIAPLLRGLAAFLGSFPVLLNLVSNPLILAGIGFELGLSWAFFYTPLAEIYYFAPVPWHVYLFAFHGAFFLLLFEETKKYLRRKGYPLEYLG